MEYFLRRLLLHCGLLALLGSIGGFAAEFPAFDFARPDSNRDWHAQHDLAPLQPTAEGLALDITGGDPYCAGPAVDFPPGQPLWLLLRLKSDTGGNAQVFYFNRGPSEADSIRAYFPPGEWAEVKVPLPALGPGIHFRIDPPGTSGRCVLGSMRFQSRIILKEPEWPRPEVPATAAKADAISSGELTLVQSANALSAFQLNIGGQPFAIGHNHAPVGYVFEGQQRWFLLSNSPANPARVTRSVRTGLRVEATFTDPDGARWQINQQFNPASRPTALNVDVSITTDHDRRVISLPLLLLHSGAGSFGTNKTQALMAGVEYLENEESSSERDVIGRGSLRRVPESLKLTFPLMALAYEDRWLALSWEQSPRLAALHDSPDRIFHSGGHVMGIVFPGATQNDREDGQLLPHDAQLLRANEPLILHATISAGRGRTIVPAVQDYVARRGLPALPPTAAAARDYYRRAAHGWLDSAIRDGARFRHAVGGSFGSSPAADAALFMEWLAPRVADDPLRARLEEMSRQAFAAVPSAQLNSAAVGHIRTPAPALVHGSVGENADVAAARARGTLGHFEPDGSVLYRRSPGSLDFGRTHWAPDANGLTATFVTHVLEDAAFSGDWQLINEGLRLLRALSKFRDSVPRGAQTWEVPLHTPDILASAYLVRAYTLGYELTHEADFLEQARYWAWTGVPFIYLTPPNERPVGVYSTIPVFGSTHYNGMLWLGLPVQWCGLVYGDAIRRFARHDPTGPWIQLANGIAAAGIQHTHTAAEPAYQGLLPDSFDLRAQVRNPVPINPGTLQPEAIQLFGEAPIYDFAAVPSRRLLIHAPGPISELKDQGDAVSWRVAGWPTHTYHLLINGLTSKPLVRLNGSAIPLESPHQFQPDRGRLILEVSGAPSIELKF